MAIKRIQTRLDLLRKIISAFNDAEKTGIRDPLGVFKKVLDKRTEIKAEKSRPKKSRD